jgi:tetratricopeptide (TPR) repeat protein
VTLDRAHWQRARALFDELVELDGAERIARLDVLGADDRVLRRTVERLLAADTDAEDLLRDWSFGSALGRPATVANARDPLGIVGHTVSHFRVKECLASGGMGVVYTAEDLQLGRVVALKFPLPHQLLAESVKERFVNEARSAGALDHPNLCTVYEVAESAHGLFLVMPLYPGETLKARLARDGTLPADDALAITQQITTGLASAHAAGIVHRDLKPANVMLLPDGTVKVLDFGLAKIRDVSLTRSHSTLGTIGYVSPEQIRGDQVDARTDLWSIGVMLHEMLTGALPFRGEHEIAIVHGILHREPSRPSALTPSLSRQLDDLIAALLQKDAGDRYASADALLADIAGLRSGAALAHRAPFWGRSASRRRVRTVTGLPRWSYGLVAAALVVLAGSAALQREKTGEAAPPVATRIASGEVRRNVEQELSRETAATLGARLTEAERDSIARRVAVEVRAYDAYLRARAAEVAAATPQRMAPVATEKMRKARSPYSPARGADSVLDDTAFARREQARAEAEAALRLRLALLEGHEALGEYRALTGDVSKAIDELGFPLGTSPHSASLPYRLGFIMGERAGRLEDALAAYERAAGDRNGAATHARFSALYVQRRYADALAMLDSSNSELTHDANVYLPTSLMRAQLQTALGERRLARASYSVALSLLRDSLTAHPGDQRIRVSLALALAGLGEKGEAAREAHRAMNLVAANSDARIASSVMGVAVEVLARVGETDDALDLVELLFSTHAGREITVPYLRVWPGFDPLRNDQRFEALLARFGADSARETLPAGDRQ